MNSRLNRALSAVGLVALVLGALTAVAPGASATPARPAVSTVGGPLDQHKITTVDECDQDVAAGHAACDSVRRTDIHAHTANQLRAMDAGAATPAGFGPNDLQSAYELPAAAQGSGQRIYIIDAYDDKTAESDLASYRSQYGLPPCTTANGCFQKLNQTGATSPLPGTNAGWAGEESLDVDMVSAACPKCAITLMEANNNSNANLYAAVSTANSLGAKFVSMSFGGSEFSTESSQDATFKTSGVVYTASTGDDAYADGVEYPSASPRVVAVGGTSLYDVDNDRGWRETAWSDGGSGCSKYEAQPAFQTSAVGSACARRTVADVSAVADPATGVAVYNTGDGGWTVYGGTSASAPIIASVYALAGTPSDSDVPASLPYSKANDLHDIASGTNGTCSPAALCTARAGWDGPTGLGTPNGVAAFDDSAPSAAVVTVSTPPDQNNLVGQSADLTVSASDTDSTQTLTYTATHLPDGLSIDSSTGEINGAPTTAGNYYVTVTASDNSGTSGVAEFTWDVRPTPTAGDAYVGTYGSLVEQPASGGALRLGDGIETGCQPAVDPAGDVYVADYDTGRVTEIPAAGGPQMTVLSGLSGPCGLALDAAGDLFVGTFTSKTILKRAAGATTTTQIASGYAVSAMTVGADGLLYATNDTNSRIVRMTTTGANQTNVISSGLSFPFGVAVGSDGTIYVADSHNNRVVKLPPGGALTSVWSGTSPTGVALDSAGDLFIGTLDSLYELPPGGGTAATVASGYNTAEGLVVNSPAPVFSADAAPGQAYTNAAYDYTFAAGYPDEANPTYALTSGALPPGLVLNPTSGELSGTPTTTGTYTFTVQAQNAVSITVGTQQSITVDTGVAPTLTGASQAPFVEGRNGVYRFTVTGTPRPTLTESGSLPSGLSLVDNGNGAAAITGTPAAGSAGTYPISIVATNPVSTATLSVTLTVNAPSTAPQPIAQTVTIRSTPPNPATVGGTYSPQTSGGGSGNPVVLSADRASTGCTVSGGVVTFTSVGTCVIDANQAGGNGFATAPTAKQSFSVVKKTQQITFTQPAAERVGSSETMHASAASGLRVVLKNGTPSVCTLSGTSVRGIAPGTCSITATQPGNGAYGAATPITRTFQIGS